MSSPARLRTGSRGRGGDRAGGAARRRTALDLATGTGDIAMRRAEGARVAARITLR